MEFLVIHGLYRISWSDEESGENWVAPGSKYNSKTYPQVSSYDNKTLSTI
jgi:hypothetical protein